MWNHYVMCLKLIQGLFVSYILIKKKKEINRVRDPSNSTYIHVSIYIYIISRQTGVAAHISTDRTLVILQEHRAWSLVRSCLKAPCLPTS